MMIIFGKPNQILVNRSCIYVLDNEKSLIATFLSLPMQYAWWAHMHRFLSVCDKNVDWN